MSQEKTTEMCYTIRFGVVFQFCPTIEIVPKIVLDATSIINPFGSVKTTIHEETIPQLANPQI